MSLFVFITQLLIYVIGSYTFRNHTTKYLINVPRNKYVYKIYTNINENNDIDFDSNNENFNIPYAITDPIPSQLNILENEKETQIRQTLWDENIPLDKVMDRIDQLENPKKYNKFFEDHMTTSITLSSHPSKPIDKSEEHEEEKVEDNNTIEGYDSTTEYDTDEYESGYDTGYDTEYDTEFDLLSYDFFHLHPSYVGLLEKLMKKKVNQAAGIEFTDVITNSEFENKIISSDYFNKAAELALDLNCLVESDITDVKWILEVNNVVEQILASHNYKLESIKWSGDTIYILIKQKYLSEYEIETLQNEVRDQIYKLKFKFHIPKLDMLGIFLESEPITDITKM